LNALTGWRRLTQWESNCCTYSYSCSTQQFDTAFHLWWIHCNHIGWHHEKRFFMIDVSHWLMS
jgi:hypothetical protein